MLKFDDMGDSFHCYSLLMSILKQKRANSELYVHRCCMWTFL